MRIAQISDCHLGYSSGKKKHPITQINLREQDGYDAFEEAIDQIILEKPDIVICSGDIFHSPNPSIYTLVKCQELLNKFVEAGIPFYNIAGNHDATDSVKDIPSNRILHQPLLNVFSFVEPYIKVEFEENIVVHFVSHHGYVAQQETMEELKPVEGKFNILCTHGSVFDPESLIILHSEQSPREVVIPQKVLDLGWDYIIMGHIHERGWVGSPDKSKDLANRKTFYGGSLIRRGYSDKPCKLGRGWTLWTIENNDMTPEFFNVHQRPQYDIPIYCEGKEVQEIENEMIKNFQKINLEETPLVRFTLVDLTSKQKMQLDWKVLSEYTSLCLSFTTRLKTKEELKAEISGESFSFDLMTAFSEFWEQFKVVYEEEEQEKIKKISDTLLKKGQEIVLTK